MNTLSHALFLIKNPKRYLPEGYEIKDLISMLHGTAVGPDMDMAFNKWHPLSQLLYEETDDRLHQDCEIITEKACSKPCFYDFGYGVGIHKIQDKEMHYGFLKKTWTHSKASFLKYLGVMLKNLTLTKQ